MTHIHVVFKKWRNDQSIIALMPYETINSSPDFCLSYQHIGQHGAASADLSPYVDSAKPAEYSDLQKELESLGYSLTILTRIPKDARKIRQIKIAKTKKQ